MNLLAYAKAHGLKLSFTFAAGIAVGAIMLNINDNNGNSSPTADAPPSHTENATTPPQPSTNDRPSPRDDMRGLSQTFDAMIITRPNGVSFTASVVASCGKLADDYSDNQLAAYENACKDRTQAVLNYYACDRNGFLNAVPTSNPEIRAHSLGRAVSEIDARHLLSEEQVQRIGSRGENTFTVTQVSSLDAASPYADFVNIGNCGDVAFRGATPNTPKP